MLSCAAQAPGSPVRCALSIAALQHVVHRCQRYVLSIPHASFADASQHRADAKNTKDMPFDFTEANYEIVENILAKYPDNYKQSGIIPLLDLAQRQCGNFLPLAAMDKVAEVCGVPAVQVYETASFYTMFNREPVGKYFIQLCGTTPCMVCGSEDIKKTIESHLGIKEGRKFCVKAKIKRTCSNHICRHHC